MRFHLLSIEHTAVNKTYTNCAFTQKVLNLAKMLMSLDHEVILYGNEGSDTSLCTEFVPILKADELLDHKDIHKYDANGPMFQKFHSRVIEEIHKRKQKYDFLLCPWITYSSVANAHKDMIVVESGIGYGGGNFAPFRIFESYAIMHATYGLPAVIKADKFQWYDRVIPNYFDTADFEYSHEKENYALFLGMRHGGTGKGYQVARDACRDAGIELRVAGNDAPPVGDNVTYLGQIGVEERKQQLKKARCLLAPSLYIEPFAGVQAEAFLSGTPVISTDWGAFVEYNIHGVTGFRCHTHYEFVRAIDACDALDPQQIYLHGLKFDMMRVRHDYEDYFNCVMKIFTGKGWYEK